MSDTASRNGDLRAGGMSSGGVTDAGLPAPAGAGGGDQPSPTRRKPGGLAPQRGRREMKEYPLTDSDMHDLGTMGLGTIFFFSVGGICTGIWSNILTSMAFLPADAPKELIAVWADRKNVALYAAIICYVIGVILALMGFTRIEKIRSETEFTDGQPRRRPWHVALFIVVGIALFCTGYWLGKP